MGKENINTTNRSIEVKRPADKAYVAAMKALQAKVKELEAEKLALRGENKEKEASLMDRKEDSTERLRAMTEKYERGLVVSNELNMRINVLEYQLLEGERMRGENMRHREEIQRLMRTGEES